MSLRALLTSLLAASATISLASEIVENKDYKGPKTIVSYSMCAWVARTGGTLLRQEKTLKGRLELPGGGNVEFTSHSVQSYRRYGEFELTIPEAAKQILAPEPEKKKEGS